MTEEYKKQIEEQGWKFHAEYFLSDTKEPNIMFQKGNYYAAFSISCKFLGIIPIDCTVDPFSKSIRYFGKCRDIEDFKTICNLLEL